MKFILQALAFIKDFLREKKTQRLHSRLRSVHKEVNNLRKENDFALAGKDGSNFDNTEKRLKDIRLLDQEAAKIERELNSVEVTPL